MATEMRRKSKRYQKSWLLKSFPDDVQDGLFVCACIACIMMVVFAILIYSTDMTARLPGCLFYERTGLWCPGCGGTRAFIALTKLHPLESLRYHVAVLYGAMLCAIIVAQRIDKAITGKGLELSLCPAHLLTGIALMGANMCLHNFF